MEPVDILQAVLIVANIICLIYASVVIVDNKAWLKALEDVVRTRIGSKGLCQKCGKMYDRDNSADLCPTCEWWKHNAGRRV